MRLQFHTILTKELSPCPVRSLNEYYISPNEGILETVNTQE